MGLPPDYQAAVHAPYAQDRDRILSVLSATLSTDSDAACGSEELKTRKLLRKLQACCASPQIWYEEEADRTWLSEQRCRSRLCPLCARSRSFGLFARIDPIVKEMQSARFVTLTLRSVDGPLAPQIARLQACFAKLRRSKIWQAHFKGGVSTVEITFNPKTQQWHPHLHLIVDGTFVQATKLADEWERVTGDSRIIDIRMVHGRQNLIRYLVTYVSKSSSIEHLPDNRLEEFAHAIHGLRLVNTFGTARRLKPEPPDYNGRSNHEFVAYLSQLLHAAQRSDQEAAALAAAVLSRTDQDDTPGPSPQYPALDPQGRPIIDRLRTWLRRKEESQHAHDPPRPQHPSRNHSPLDRPERLWQDIGLAGHH